jgi:hypothetical protein
LPALLFQMAQLGLATKLKQQWTAWSQDNEIYYTT